MLHYLTLRGGQLGRLRCGRRFFGGHDQIVKGSFPLYGKGDEGDRYDPYDHGGLQSLSDAGGASCYLLEADDHEGGIADCRDDGGQAVVSHRRFLSDDADYHAEQPDGRHGEADGPPEVCEGARARGGHDDVHRPPLYPDPAGRDGQDHEGADRPRCGF